MSLGRSQATNRTTLNHLGVVPAVLDGILRPAGKQLGDLGPSVTQTLLRIVHNTRLLFGPRSLDEQRVQLIHVALANALGDATWEKGGNDWPGLSLLARLQQNLVFVTFPWRTIDSRFQCLSRKKTKNRDWSSEKKPFRSAKKKSPSMALGTFGARAAILIHTFFQRPLH
jgi:hypothetical protein